MFKEYTTAELKLALIRHKEGRVVYPAKIRKEIEREIECRASERG